MVKFKQGLSQWTARAMAKILRPFGFTIQRHRTIFELALERAGVQERRLTIVDIGANTGQGLAMANRLERSQRLAIRYHAFEPIGTTFEELRRNSRRYTNLHITLHKLGLSDRNDTVTINLASNSLCNSINNSAHWQQQGNGSETFEIAPLDSVLQVDDIPGAALLKVDIEGHELSCLRGMVKLLEARAFKAIIIETGFNPRDYQHTYFADIQAFLLEFSYLCAGIEEAEIVPPKWDATPCIGYANAIFCPQPCKSVGSKKSVQLH
jgi:FkbM family methyltransferase